MEKAVILLSGGLDSATALGIAVAMGYVCYPLSFDYGQRNKRELDAQTEILYHYWELAGKASKSLVKKGKRIRIAGMNFKTSALLDSSVEIPKRSLEQIETELPVTYVSCRNSIFLSFAASYAESLGCKIIYTGFNGGLYPDSTGPYVDVMEIALSAGSNSKFEIRTPLLEMDKKAIIEKALSLSVPIELTWSCYESGSEPCGKCDPCVSRAKAFVDLKKHDPALPNGVK